MSQPPNGSNQPPGYQPPDSDWSSEASGVGSVPPPGPSFESPAGETTPPQQDKAGGWEPTQWQPPGFSQNSPSGQPSADPYSQPSAGQGPTGQPSADPYSAPAGPGSAGQPPTDPYAQQPPYGQAGAGYGQGDPYQQQSTQGAGYGQQPYGASGPGYGQPYGGYGQGQPYGYVGPHPEGQKLLIWSIVSLLCCAPIAIWVLIQSNTILQSSGGADTSKVNTAKVIAIIALVLWAIGGILRFTVFRGSWP